MRRFWVRNFLRMVGLDCACPWIRDCFSSTLNRRFPLHWTSKEDAMKQPWSDQEVLWMNPPWSLWPQVAQRIQTTRCYVIGVLPAWDGRFWVQELLKMAFKVVYLERGSKVFELGGKVMGGVKWGVYVVFIQNMNPQAVPAAPPELWTATQRRRWRRDKKSAQS